METFSKLKKKKILLGTNQKRKPKCHWLQNVEPLSGNYCDSNLQGKGETLNENPPSQRQGRGIEKK